MNVAGLNPIISNYDILKYQNVNDKKIDSKGNNSENSAKPYNAQELSDVNNFETKLKRAMEQKDEKALKEVCRNMEEIFLQMMYKQMKATVPKANLVSEGAGTEIFDSMLDETLMKEASTAEGIGLADMMYKQLYKNMNNIYKKNVIDE